MQPYQNKLTGGFRIRTDKQNRIIPRDQIYAHFKQFDEYKNDLSRLMPDEAAVVAARDIMTADGPVLTIGILPREHYDNHPRFAPRQGYTIKGGPTFPYHSH